MKKSILKVLFFLFLNKFIIFILNRKILSKILYLLSLIFDFMFILNDFLVLKFVKLRTALIKVSFKFINKKKAIMLLLNNISKNDFVKLFLLNLVKVIFKLAKIVLNFLGFIIYAVWSYFNTILLYAIGYILLEFGATRIYDPSQDITSREIWEIISKKLSILRKKHLSKSNIFLTFSILYEKTKIEVFNLYNYVNNLFIVMYYKSFYVIKSFVFNFYLFILVLVFIFLINNFLFLKKIFYLKSFKIESNSFLKNFKIYFILNYLKYFINLFKKKKLFFLNKKIFEKKKFLNLFNYKTFVLSFKVYLKTKNKLKVKMLYIKNVFQFNRFKNYFCYRIKFWSSQKRFLHFYLKLLKKSKKIKMGALRVIYIEEWWVYKFYLKNYYFSTILKVICIFFNLIKIKIIFVFLYLNFLLNIIFI